MKNFVTLFTWDVRPTCVNDLGNTPRHKIQNLLASYRKYTFVFKKHEILWNYIRIYESDCIPISLLLPVPLKLDKFCVEVHVRDDGLSERIFCPLYILKTYLLNYLELLPSVKFGDETATSSIPRRPPCSL